MPWFRRHHKQKPGYPIQARTLGQMAETCDWASQIQANPPLAIMSTINGPLLRLAGMLFSVYIAETTTTVSARSGSTPGSGTVQLQTWNGTVLAALSGATPTVYNWNSASGGVATGKFCIILRIAGSYWLLVAEC